MRVVAENYEQTHTHTHARTHARTHAHTDNYSNPRCAIARRGLIGASLSEPLLDELAGAFLYGVPFVSKPKKFEGL